ncbi:hypothetical protein U879_11800 [Defluviimonas sp. 20V17]|uniref:Flagella basal body P-ring formation protein FlgA n=1 Tax=Allgaiera indica TaxID=765699 RepID=A0AAN4ZXI0_9RHOB|nr:flagellar basal body P-ring formation chaperone FlgA [Allgaiera indica]KDB03495.1 hypothetical protein U879_11800 [Defluviimonas sp. 20V17]GHD98104.1 hypothetical protein GCM10008024_00280 [Allgaiera indica]SDW53830.1 flagella basal body P-ring formation protein FlgA [Allgaiera indica]
MRPEVGAPALAAGLAGSLAIASAAWAAGGHESAAAIRAAIAAKLGGGPVKVLPNGGAMMPACRGPLDVGWLPSTNAGFRTASVHCASPSWTIYAGVRTADDKTVLVATRAIPAGGAIDGTDTARRSVPATAVLGPVVTPARLSGDLRARGPIAAGQPILTSMTDLPVVVRSGQKIVLQVRQGGLLISARGVALQNGTAGEEIEVENSATHRRLRADVVRRLPAASGVYAMVSDDAAN